MDAYKVVVKDLAKRQHEIDQKATSSSEQRPFYKLHSGNDVLPVIKLDIRVPVYRIENYRTQTRQLAYIHANQLAENFFSSGQEDVAAQQAQHGLLVELAHSGSGDTIMAIDEALAQDNQQTEPLLLTREGVVVNGNRRLAAMREMYTSEPAVRSGFATIDAMILPAGVTQDELRRVEVRLQMQPLTQLPYDWADSALAVRDLRNRDIPDREIAGMMRLEKESEVAAIVERLTEAEIYLQDYLKQPGEYTHIAPHEQLFGDLQQALRSNRTTADKESVRRIGHVMARHSRAFGSRVYDYKAAFGTKAGDVLRRLAQRHEIALPDSNPTEADDIFDGGEPDTFAPVRVLLERDDISETLATDIRDIFDELKEESKEQDIGNRALKNAQRANTALNEIMLSQADPATFASLRAQLQSAVDRATALITEIADRVPR